jgi:hypothetical protein
VLEGDFVEETRRSTEVAEVLNYVQATETALERIKERPISFNLMRSCNRFWFAAHAATVTTLDGYESAMSLSGPTTVESARPASFLHHTVTSFVTA